MRHSRANFIENDDGIFLQEYWRRLCLALTGSGGGSDSFEGSVPLWEGRLPVASFRTVDLSRPIFTTSRMMDGVLKGEDVV